VASGEPEAGNVGVADGRNDKGMLDADVVGQVAFKQGQQRASYDYSDHKTGAFAGEWTEI
jgi:hypothetical protein